MKILTLDETCINAVISERPFVKLLTVPKCEILEPLPGIQIESWTAVAQVEEMLAIVELKVTQ
jgi:hypothetical protein